MPFQHNGIVMTDLQGRIKYANIFMCDLLGVEHNELEERLGLEFAFPEDLESAQALFAASQARGGKPFRFRLRRSNGEAVWVDVMCSPMQTPDGETYGVMATVTPATTRS
jgi:PAS domain S-box-containing protein